MTWIGWVFLNIIANGTAVALYKLETQQRDKSYVAVVFVSVLTAVIVYLPYFGYRFIQDPVLFTNVRGWGFYFIGLLIATMAYSLNMRAIKMSELSVIGPLDNLRPFFVILFSLLLLRQVPTGMLIAGSALIVLGAYLLQQQKHFGTAMKQIYLEKGSRYMVMATALFALLGIIDKLTLAYIKPEYAVMTGLTGLMLVYGIGLFIQTKQLAFRKYISWPLVLCGLLMIAGSLGIFKALQLSTPNYVIPVQMTRTFFVAFLGFIFFKEKGVVRKLAAGAVMFAGVLMVLQSA